MQTERDAPTLSVHIEHEVDEIFDGEELQQRYNFLLYHFQFPSAYLIARTYIDDILVVTLSGPFAGPTNRSRVKAPEAEEAVLSYLSRRFETVKRR